MQDAEELGVIFIGMEGKGYSVKECVPKHARGNKWKCGVMLETPERKFIFMCEQEREQREWLQALRQVLHRPMTPQDHTSKQGRKVLQTYATQYFNRSAYGYMVTSKVILLSLFIALVFQS